MLGYFVRPYVTNKQTRKYFIPALLVRFLGAIALGLVYQFYYNGGDTFNYFTYGSRWIWEAFNEDILAGINLLLDSGGDRTAETYQYNQHIWYFRDPNSYLIVRITAFFDLFTFHTYSATALFFAIFNFCGMWALFQVLLKVYSNIKTEKIAFAILFVPSVIFWGSGILKDTITLGALAWLVWGLLNVISLGRLRMIYFLVIISSLVLLISIKIYIIIALIPSVIIWLYFKYLFGLKSYALRLLVVPVLGTFVAALGYIALNQLGNANKQYAFSNISEKVAITAYDIRYGWGARTQGDGGYDIGLPDGTWQSMLKLAPAAINVSLFRPYLWEARNPLMFLSALESLLVLILTIRLLIRGSWRKIRQDPFLIFCLSLALIFAFATGISTFNFGTLMRYKIPQMPFFLLFLIVGTKEK
jgi:hypothetical protein